MTDRAEPTTPTAEARDASGLASGKIRVQGLAANRIRCDAPDHRARPSVVGRLRVEGLAPMVTLNLDGDEIVQITTCLDEDARYSEDMAREAPESDDEDDEQARWLASARMVRDLIAKINKQAGR